MTIAVLIPTLPERADLLGECVASVAAQTRKPRAVLIGWDDRQQGIARMFNGLALAAPAEWLALFDDDNLMYPNHLSVLWGYRTGADVVHTAWETTGRDGWGWDVAHRGPCSEVTPEHNSVPGTVLIRSSVFLDSGGMDPAANEPDWELWLRLKAAGAVFRCVHTVTWTYRFGADNYSLSHPANP